MKDCPASVFPLKFILKRQCFKNIVCAIYRELAGVGVKRSCSFSIYIFVGANDFVGQLFVEHGKPIRCAFSRSRLEVKHISRLLLDPCNHVPQKIHNFKGKIQTFFTGDICA